jgi:hypothetical protein
MTSPGAAEFYLVYVNFITIRGHGENLQGFSLQQALSAFNRLFGNFGEICSS